MFRDCIINPPPFLTLHSYFSEMDRVLGDDYIPTEQDVLRSRVQTTGIIETAFKVNKLTYRCVLRTYMLLYHVARVAAAMAGVP